MTSPSPPRLSHQSRALVLGSGISGLCAARALAPHFDRVSVIERDRIGPEVGPRRGVPQSAQPHGLLPNGRVQLEALFPGFHEVAQERGATEWDLTYESARYTTFGWAPRRQLGFTGLACTRPLTESVIRELLLSQNQNVEIIEGVKVTGLLLDGEQELLVRGVRTDSPDPALGEIHAHMVVDALGRGSKVLKWLAAAGLPMPEERICEARCNYATRHYRRPEGAKDWWWRSMIIDNEAPHFPRGGSIIPVEGDRWIVTAIGNDGDYAPTDPEAWEAWIAGLRSPVMGEVLAKAEPLTDVMQSRTTRNRWVQMQQQAYHPEGLLIVGDSAVVFNPSYGQGITSAAIQASRLDALIRTHGFASGGRVASNVTRGFYRAQAKLGKEGWDYSTTLDLRWPTAKGERRWSLGIENRFSKLFEKVALQDGELMRTLIPLLDFGNSRAAVFHPAFAARFWYQVAKMALTRPSLPGPRQLPAFATS